MRTKISKEQKKKLHKVKREARRKKTKEVIEKGKEKLKNGKEKGRAAIPSVFTLGNAFFGFLALINIAQGDIIRAVAFIVFGQVLDTLDGHLARKMDLASDFGLQLDSLADTLSFVIVPAMMIYFVFFRNMMGALVGAVVVICGILRLARFNIQESKTHYIGISTPLFTTMVVVLALVKELAPRSILMTVPEMDLAIVFIILALSMVSPLKYFAFKQAPFKKYQMRLLIAMVLFGAAALVFDITTTQAIVLEHLFLWGFFLLPLLFEAIAKKRRMLLFNAGFLGAALILLLPYFETTLLLIYPVFYIVLGLPAITPCFEGA